MQSYECEGATMSALDDVILQAIDVCRDDQLDAARAELELLRAMSEHAWSVVGFYVMGKTPDYLPVCDHCHSVWDEDYKGSHQSWCQVARILRTDPERAKAMGLGWAL